jgi:ectoine hydroxylase-related dioxygenase (phytanoyl-CoA dioxygenase family)
MLDQTRTEIAENGFAIIRSVLASDALQKIKLYFEELELRPESELSNFEPQFDLVGTSRRLRKLRRLYWNDRDFWSNQFAAAFDLCCNLVPNSPELILHAAFLKPSHVGGTVDLHQDQALWDYQYPGAVTLWVAIDSATTHNGGLVGIPGSHLAGLQEHLKPDIEHRHSYLPWSSRLTPIDLNSGDAVAWHRHFIHGSPANISSDDRIGVVCVFADTSQSSFKSHDIARWPYRKDLA